MASKNPQDMMAALRPIFDSLRHLADTCRDDVVMEGRGGYTPFVLKPLI